MKCCVILLLLFLSMLGHASPLCTVTTSVAAERLLTDDGLVSATLYAGHEEKMLPVKVLWQQTRLPRATIILPQGHLLLNRDVPNNWYDGQSALTKETLVFKTRSGVRSWQVDSLPSLPLPSSLTTETTGLLNLAPNSPLWYSHAAMVFTGTQLRFVGHQIGQGCNAMQALQQTAGTSSQHARFYMDSPLQHTLKVVHPSGDVRGQWTNVTLVWGVDSAQTLIPAGAAALLERNENLQLELDGRVVLLTSAEMQLGHLAAPFIESDSFAMSLIHTTAAGHAEKKKRIQEDDGPKLVLGRRLLSRLASAWSMDSAGHVAVQLASAPAEVSTAASNPGVPSDSVPSGVLWTATVLGILLIMSATYWTSYLAGTLRIHYAPTPNTADSVDGDDFSDRIDRKSMGLGLFILALVVVIHALMGAYGGHGTLADASLEQPLEAFILAHWIGTAVVGLLFILFLMTEALRLARVIRRLKPVSIQLYAVGFGILVTRSLVAALMVAAGTTLAQLAVTIVIALVFGFFPSLYCTLLLWLYLATSSPLYNPPLARKPSDRYGIEKLLVILTLAIMLGLTVVLGFSIPLWLIDPFQDCRNGLYSPVIIRTVCFVAISIAIFGTSFALYESCKRYLMRAKQQWEELKMAIEKHNKTS